MVKLSVPATGLVLSTVTLNAPEAALVLPIKSVCFTVSVYAPSARFELVVTLHVP